MSSLSERQIKKPNSRWVPVTPDLERLPIGVLRQVVRHIRVGTRYLPKV